MDDGQWDPNGLATLNPGEGAFICMPATAPPTTITFTGTPHVPVLPVVLPCGCDHFNLLSRQTTNAPTTFQDLTGFNPTEGTSLYRYNPGASGGPSCPFGPPCYTVYTFSGGAWAPSTPTLNLGESVFINVPCSNVPPCCPDTGGVKYLQLPNLTNGIDVNAAFSPPDPRDGLTWVLADDFPCTNSGPITDIHLWGSWLFDAVDTNATYTLAIWSDAPTNATGLNYSRPDQLLWTQTYGSGQYALCPYANQIENFYDGDSAILGAPSLIGGSSNLFYLCFDASPTNTFQQTGKPNAKTNYWLSVTVQSFAGNRYFGWKSSATAYNDAAVAAFNGNFYPLPGDWHPMTDPQGIPLNMAFKITTATNSPTTNCPTTNALVLNTGYNQNSNTVYGYGQADAFWWVTADPTLPPTFLPRPATVIQPNPAWQPAQANSQWISSYPTEADNLNGEYDFETYFCVASNAANLVLNICLRADDQAGAYLNGNPIPLAPPNTTWGAPVPACGTVINPSWFVPGLNVLLVRVTNVYAVAMGLNAEASVTGSGLIAQSAPCCRPNSGISGQKYYDLNNNGVHDPGEPALSGWTMHLSNGATAVTDGNGFYYFLGLAPGTYTVTETVQSGWTQTAPAGGWYTVTLGAAQQINGQDFGNYRPNNTNCVHIFDCPTNIVAQCTGAGGAVVAYSATATSLCTTNSVIVTFTPPSTTFFPVGTTVVHVTAIDTLDNWSTNCSFTVTVVDTLPPVINCPSNIVVSSACTNVPVFYTPTATDACCGSNVTVVSTPPSGSFFAPGTTTPVSCMATDCHGNSNSCTFTVTVLLGTNCCPTTNALVLNTGYNQNSNTVYGYGQADAFWWVTADPTLPPTFLPRPATVIQPNPAWQPAQANSQWISSYPTEADNLNGEYDFETFFCLASNAANLVLNICLRADDQAGAYLNGNPIPLTPPNTTWGAPVPACGTVINPSWFVPGLNVLLVRVTNVYAVAMGLNVEASVTGSGLIAQSAPCCRPNSGISGQKYYDLNNNGVHDPGEPALSGWTMHLSNGATAVTDGNGFYYFLGLMPGTYTVTETAESGWTQTAPAGGWYTVTLGTAQQINGQDFGNYRTNDTNCVHIFDCPTNIVAQCTGAGGAVVAYSATATSSCTTNSVIVTFTPPSTTFFPVGTTVVHVTAIDTLDNWSTNCSFTVTVVDTLPPVINCPSNIVVSSACTNVPVFYTPTATDACCGSNVTVVSTPPSGSFFAPGTTTPVSCMATDCHGNSNSCTFTVTVLSAPLQVLCSTNKTVTCGTAWTFDPPTATSCCTNLTITALPPITNGICPQVITQKWIITDSCGNSNTCTQVVMVINTAPPVVTPGIVLNYSAVPGSRISFSGGGFTFVGSSNVQFEIDDVFDGFGDSLGFDGYFSSGGPFTIGTITINGSVQTAPVSGSGILHITDGANELTGTIQWVDITTLGTSGVLNLNGQVNLTGIAYAGASQDLQALLASGTAQVDLTFQFIPALTLTQLKATGGLTDYSGSILGAPVVTTPPLISCATNKTVQCGTAWTFDPPTSISACCTNLTIIPLFTLTNSTGCPRVISQVWKAFDCCSNSVICTQAVTVLDTVPPVITCPSNIVIATCLTNVPVTWSVTATDPCSSVTVTSSPPSGTIFHRDTTNIVTAVARDACGNTNTCSFLVIVRRPTLTIAISGSGFPVMITITWVDGGILQQANSVLGPWTDLPLATSPYNTPASAAQKYYRLRCP